MGPNLWLKDHAEQGFQISSMLDILIYDWRVASILGLIYCPFLSFL